MKKPKELRLKMHQITLTNQSIVELAYLARDMRRAMENGERKHMYFEEFNCIENCCKLCEKLLGIVDEKYLWGDPHKELAEYYAITGRAQNLKEEVI